MSEDVKQFIFSSTPKYVGMYCLGGSPGFFIHLTNKPNWLDRTMMKLLGWEWRDTQ